LRDEQRKYKRGRTGKSRKSGKKDAVERRASGKHVGTVKVREKGQSAVVEGPASDVCTVEKSERKIREGRLVEQTT
jgi:hypothetical protein